MSQQRILSLNPNTNLGNVLHYASQSLTAQGYTVVSQMLSPMSATLTVTKDRDGFKNIIGLGIECRATLSVINSNQLNVNIDSEWTNKIVALAVGWFFCLIPFITGIVGAVNQNDLPAKIYNALTTSASMDPSVQQP